MSNVVFQNDTPFEVFQILDEMGFHQNLLGYEQLAYAIKYMMDEYPRKPQITAEVYPAVANKFMTTSTRVERNIRHAIERAFICGDYDTIYKYFGSSIDVDAGKVTNSHFIHNIAIKLRLQNK